MANEMYEKIYYMKICMVMNNMHIQQGYCLHMQHWNTFNYKRQNK